MMYEYEDYSDSYAEQKEVANEMTGGCMIFIVAFFVILAVAVICYLMTK